MSNEFESLESLERRLPIKFSWEGDTLTVRFTEPVQIGKHEVERITKAMGLAERAKHRNAKRRWRYATDPEYRRRVLKRQSDRYHSRRASENPFVVMSDLQKINRWLNEQQNETK